LHLQDTLSFSKQGAKAEMVALLEQHEITLWTVVGLLVGALDVRLDPHYRLSRQLLSRRRLQTSWRLIAHGMRNEPHFRLK